MRKRDKVQIILMIIGVTIVGPALVVASLNQLFNLNAPYNLFSFAAVFMLGVFINISINSK